MPPVLRDARDFTARAGIQLWGSRVGLDRAVHGRSSDGKPKAYEPFWALSSISGRTAIRDPAGSRDAAASETDRRTLVDHIVQAGRARPAHAPFL